MIEAGQSEWIIGPERKIFRSRRVGLCGTVTPSPSRNQQKAGKKQPKYQLKFANWILYEQRYRDLSLLDRGTLNMNQRGYYSRI